MKGASCVSSRINRLAVLLTGFVLVVSSALPAADWGWMHPYPQGQDLTGISGVTGGEVVAVGEWGATVRHDGGAWEATYGGTTQNLNGVWCASGTSVYAVGAGGVILHRDGTVWSMMASGTTQALNGVWGSAGNDIFAVGASGTVRHYTGSTWGSMTSGTTAALYAVWGCSGSNVFAVGSGGTILHYDGVNWSPMTSGTTQPLYGVWGSSCSDVFAVGGSGTILHYDGVSWSAMTSGTTSALYAVCGCSGSNVFAVGVGGVIRHYDGSTWSAMTSGTTQLLRGVWGSSCSDVYAVGSLGVIVHYNGTMWSLVSESTTTQQVNDVWMCAGDRGFAVGNAGTILSYEGAGWSSMANPAGANGLSGIWGASCSDVYAVGTGGMILHYDGNTWGTMTSGSTAALYAVWGTSGSDIFAVGNSGTILHYDGVNWNSMTSGTTQALYAVWGTSGSNVFAVGNSGTILHYDGVNWSAMTSGMTSAFYAVWGCSGSDVYAAGYYGAMRHYDGSTWAAVSSGTGQHINDIWGSSCNDVFVVGNGGVIQHFSDGVWSGMDSGTSYALLGVWGVGGDVYAVGAGGTVLHYGRDCWADFTADPTDGAAPLTVDFTDTSTGSPTSWLWDFGDGATSTDANPTHTYVNPGTYSVTLTVTYEQLTRTVTKTGFITVTGEIQYTLSASVIGGHGTVAPTSGTYDQGTVVQLTAVPESGYQVRAWLGTDNDSSTSTTNTVTMIGNRTVTVEFEQITVYFTLSTSVIGGHGTISPSPGSYPQGSVVILNAIPDTGYRVKAWQGTDNDASTATTNTVTMSSDRTVTVEFEVIPVQYSLSASVIDDHGTVDPTSGTYDQGTVEHLTARPDPGYQVMAWHGTDNDASKANTNTVTMNANRLVMVEFELISTPECECDLNHDGRCDMRDWLLFGKRWGATDCSVRGTATFSDDFDTYEPGAFPDSGGWQLLYGGAGGAYQYIDDTNSHSGLQSFHFVGSDCWSAQAFHETGIHRRMSLEAWVYVDEIVSCGCTPVIAGICPFNPGLGPWGTGYGEVMFSCDGNIYAVQAHYDHTQDVLLMSYTAQTWYQVRMDVDLDTRTFGVFINGVFIGSGYQIMDEGEPTGVNMGAGHGASPEVWYDKVSLAPLSPECACDLNADGRCDMRDWLLFGQDWGRTDCP